MRTSQRHVCIRTTSWLVIFLAASGAASAEDGAARRREKPGKETDAFPVFNRENTRQFVGVENQCWNCHGQTADGERIPWLPDQVYDGWIRRDEMLKWAKEDKHSEAYAVLLTPRTQKMQELLGVDEPLHLDKRCLACHTAFPIHEMPEGAKPLFAAAKIENDFRVTVGVSCEGCHGPSGDGPENSKGWFAPHQVPNTWRIRPAAEKQNEFGYYDIHTPSAKTRLCLSCHLGNAQQGRIITHEMYAAGHPPLPGFEAASFLAQQPPHWHDFSDKNPKLRAEFAERTGQTYNAAQLPVTKTVLTGAIVNLSESLKLTAALCKQDVSPDVPAPPWPELANFACYACHHDLQRPAWRQQRAVASGPGRPMLFEWPHALLFVALDTAEVPREEIEPRLAAVQDALRDRPFGEPAKLAAAASDAAKWLDNQASRIDAREFTQDDAALVLRLVCDQAAEQTLDYDSARQLVWAFQAIYTELRSRDAASETPEPRFPSDDNSSRDDPVLELLKPLEQMFVLDLRQGKDSPVVVSEKPRQILEVELERTLPPIAGYDPAVFQTRFGEIKDLLKQP